MISFKKYFVVRVLLIGIFLAAPLVLTACGGGGGGGSVIAQTKRLAGKVYAKLFGDKIGELKANIKELNGVFEMSGTLDMDGTSFDIKGTVDPENNFSVTFANTIPSSSGGSIVVADGRFSGKVAPPLAATPDTLSVVNGNWTINLPTVGGLPGATTSYTGTSDSTATAPSASTTLPAGTCTWDANAFYNPQQVVNYLGQFYTAKQAVVPFGSAGAAIFNPAVDSSNWISGGSSCGPTPFVKVDRAVCTRGVSADVITINGTAYGGGIGDAIAAYTNVTDRSFSNENNFGLPGTSYSMTCSDGGFSGTFTSTTSPSYSVCVKATPSNSATNWTSTQTVPHSTTLVKFTTAYASKGTPLRATVFNVGSIVMGLDAVRSSGVAITGNCL